MENKKPLIYTKILSDVEVLQYQGTVKSIKDILSAFNLEISSLSHTNGIPPPVVMVDDDTLIQSFISHRRKDQHNVETIKVDYCDYVFRYLNGDGKIYVYDKAKFSGEFYAR